MNKREPLEEVSKNRKLCGKTPLIENKGGQVQRTPDCRLHAHRYRDGMPLLQALKENVGEPVG